VKLNDTTTSSPLSASSNLSPMSILSNNNFSHPNTSSPINYNYNTNNTYSNQQLYWQNTASQTNSIKNSYTNNSYNTMPSCYQQTQCVSPQDQSSYASSMAAAFNTLIPQSHHSIYQTQPINQANFNNINQSFYSTGFDSQANNVTTNSNNNNVQILNQLAVAAAVVASSSSSSSSATSSPLANKSSSSSSPSLNTKYLTELADSSLNNHNDSGFESPKTTTASTGNEVNNLKCSAQNGNNTGAIDLTTSPTTTNKSSRSNNEDIRNRNIWNN
jgi:hypothetical protein